MSEVVISIINPATQGAVASALDGKAETVVPADQFAELLLKQEVDGEVVDRHLFSDTTPHANTEEEAAGSQSQLAAIINQTPVISGKGKSAKNSSSTSTGLSEKESKGREKNDQGNTEKLPSQPQFLSLSQPVALPSIQAQPQQALLPDSAGGSALLQAMPAPLSDIIENAKYFRDQIFDSYQTESFITQNSVYRIQYSESRMQQPVAAQNQWQDSLTAQRVETALPQKLAFQGKSFQNQVPINLRPEGHIQFESSIQYPLSGIQHQEPSPIFVSGPTEPLQPTAMIAIADLVALSSKPPDQVSNPIHNQQQVSLTKQDVAITVSPNQSIHGDSFHNQAPFDLQPERHILDQVPGIKHLINSIPHIVAGSQNFLSEPIDPFQAITLRVEGASKQELPVIQVFNHTANEAVSPIQVINTVQGTMQPVIPGDIIQQLASIRLEALPAAVEPSPRPVSAGQAPEAQQRVPLVQQIQGGLHQLHNQAVLARIQNPESGIHNLQSQIQNSEARIPYQETTSYNRELESLVLRNQNPESGIPNLQSQIQNSEARIPYQETTSHNRELESLVSRIQNTESGIKNLQSQIQNSEAKIPYQASTNQGIQNATEGAADPDAVSQVQMVNQEHQSVVEWEAWGEWKRLEERQAASGTIAANQKPAAQAQIEPAIPHPIKTLDRLPDNPIEEHIQLPSPQPQSSVEEESIVRAQLNTNAVLDPIRQQSKPIHPVSSLSAQKEAKNISHVQNFLTNEPHHVQFPDPSTANEPVIALQTEHFTQGNAAFVSEPIEEIQKQSTASVQNETFAPVKTGQRLGLNVSQVLEVQTHRIDSTIKPPQEFVQDEPAVDLPTTQGHTHIVLEPIEPVQQKKTVLAQNETAAPIKAWQGLSLNSSSVLELVKPIQGENKTLQHLELSKNQQQPTLTAKEPASAPQAKVVQYEQLTKLHTQPFFRQDTAQAPEPAQPLHQSPALVPVETEAVPAIQDNSASVQDQKPISTIKTEIAFELTEPTADHQLHHLTPAKNNQVALDMLQEQLAASIIDEQLVQPLKTTVQNGHVDQPQAQSTLQEEGVSVLKLAESLQQKLTRTHTESAGQKQDGINPHAQTKTIETALQQTGQQQKKFVSQMPVLSDVEITLPVTQPSETVQSIQWQIKEVQFSEKVIHQPQTALTDENQPVAQQQTQPFSQTQSASVSQPDKLHVKTVKAPAESFVHIHDQSFYREWITPVDKPVQAMQPAAVSAGTGMMKLPPEQLDRKADPVRDKAPIQPAMLPVAPVKPQLFVQAQAQSVSLVEEALVSVLVKPSQPASTQAESAVPLPESVHRVQPSPDTLHIQQTNNRIVRDPDIPLPQAQQVQHQALSIEHPASVIQHEESAIASSLKEVRDLFTLEAPRYSSKNAQAPIISIGAPHDELAPKIVPPPLAMGLANELSSAVFALLPVITKDAEPSTYAVQPKTFLKAIADDRLAADDSVISLTSSINKEGRDVVAHVVQHLASPQAMAPQSTQHVIPVIPSRIVEQIVSSARLLQRGKRQEIAIRLDPPELGIIQLKITSRNNGELVAMLSTTDSDVHRYLDVRMPELRDSMREAGINIDKCTVSLDANANREGSFSEQRPLHQQHGNQRQTNRLAETPINDPVSSIVTLEMQSETKQGIDYFA